MKDVVVVIGAGGIGQAIARRVGAGRHVVLADLRLDAAQAASKILGDAGFETSATQADLASRESIRALHAVALVAPDLLNDVTAGR